MCTERMREEQLTGGMNRYKTKLNSHPRSLFKGASVHDLRASYGQKVFFMQASCSSLLSLTSDGSSQPPSSRATWPNQSAQEFCHFQPLQTACECFLSLFDGFEYHGLAL